MRNVILIMSVNLSIGLIILFVIIVMFRCCNAFETIILFIANLIVLIIGFIMIVPIVVWWSIIIV